MIKIFLGVLFVVIVVVLTYIMLNLNKLTKY